MCQRQSWLFVTLAEMPFGQSDTRAKLIDPVIHARGWTEDLIRREETPGAIEIVDGKPRKRARGRVDYVMRIAVSAETQPFPVKQSNSTKRWPLLEKIKGTFSRLQEA